MSTNLTTLANVAAWLEEPSSSDSALLNRLIASASRFIYGYLNRPTLFQQVYSEVYDGAGRERLTLRNYPVIAVSSLTIGQTAIPASPSYGQAGYALEPWSGAPPGRPQTLNLFCYRYCHGRSNVAVTYTSGYVVQAEAHTVPGSPYQVTVNAPYGNWGQDQGVTYANGTALTAVASAPATGQYVPPNATNAYYQFAAGDANASVLISYSYIPFDVEQACIEMVAERYEYQDRIGVKSKSLGGQETISFNTAAMTDYIQASLQPYRRVLPC